MKPKRITVDETAVAINGERSRLYAAVYFGIKVILDVTLSKRHGADPAVALLHGICKKRDGSETVLLADVFGYQTVLSRLGLNSRVDYTNRNLVERRFHTFEVRVDRFHNSWVEVG